MALPQQHLDMRPEHWAKLREMLRKHEPRLSDEQVETIVQSQGVVDAIMAKRTPDWDGLIKQHVSDLAKQ